MADLNANDIEAAMKMIEGSARSMGLKWWRAKIMAKLDQEAAKAREGIDRDKLYGSTMPQAGQGNAPPSSTRPSRSR
jgi:hypothetical protein